MANFKEYTMKLQLQDVVRRIDQELGLVDNVGEIDVKIKAGPGGIGIMVDGYATHAEQDGHATPIFIEFYEDSLRVVLWNDINEMDPIIVNMEKARVEHRTGEV